MKIRDLLVVSFKNLFRQKLRTLLTITSMMVGAFLISIMMSVGNGLEDFLISQVTVLSNVQIISVNNSVDIGGMMGFGGVEEYKEVEDEDEIKNDGEIENENEIESLPEVPPDGVPAGYPEDLSGPVEDQAVDGVDSEQEMFMSDRKLDKDDLDKISEIDHIDDAQFESILMPEYVTLRNVENAKKLKMTLYGWPVKMRDDVSYVIVDEDILKESNAIVLSDKYTEEWDIEAEDLVGKEIIVNVSLAGPPIAGDSRNEDFVLVVAGLIEKSIFDQIAMVSLDTISEMGAYRFQKSIDDYKEDETAMQIVVIVDSAENVEKVDEELEKIGYISTTYEESIGQIGVVFNIINYLLSSFGIIALIVASIGIVNTLLMAIYERTREIGVMKAVGATRSTIGLMFTVEASLLGFCGGFFGLLVGWGFGQLANSILHNGLSIWKFKLISPMLGDYPQYNISVFDWDMIVLVMGVTTFVALFAGLYPAWKASKLNPIAALRHD